ncbi:defensin-like [Folsomia candida]|nr:defensin-like [Folsomia candida]
MRAIVIILLVFCVTFELVTPETMHVDKCDNFCGGSKLNPFGKSGTCKSCCMEKGFIAGGECGDFLNRHCRCTQNVPFYPGSPPGGIYPGVYPGAG